MEQENLKPKETENNDLDAVAPLMQHPKYFAEWILANCTFWGNEWFMYKGYRYSPEELFNIWNNPKNEITHEE